MQRAHDGEVVAHQDEPELPLGAVLDLVGQPVGAR